MVQILGAVPSFGETFAKNFGAGFSGGIEHGLATAQKLVGERRKNEAARQKLAGRAYKDLEHHYKAKFGSKDYLRPEEKSQYEKIYTDLLLTQPDMPEQDARELAHQIFSIKEAEQLGGTQHETSEWRNKKFPTSFGGGEAKMPLGNLGKGIAGTLNPAVELARRNPAQAFKEIPTAGLKSAEGIANLLAPPEMSEEFLNQHGLHSYKHGKYGRYNDNKLSKQYGEFARKGLSEEDKEAAEKLAEVESFAIDILGPSAASKLLKGGKALAGTGRAKVAGKAADINPEVLARMKQAKAVQEIAPAESAAANYNPLKSLEGRITPATKGATDLRVARTEPTRKLSPIQEIVETRQKQLKSHPRYASEISRDAAEREIRRAAKIPKTEIGEAGLAKRIAIAESKLPQIESAYTKAASRVRTLENSMAKLEGLDRKRVEEVYNIAKMELAEASVDLENALSNARYGSAKAGVQESAEAASRKLNGIKESIQKGEEIKLSGRDYSPKMIADAKALERKKPLPNLKGDDFYNQIHQRYLQPYRARAEQLAKELSQAERAGDWKELANLKKEQEIVSKMIKSAESEIKIHERKLALRDIGEAKLANERFKTLKQVKGASPTADVAQEKMWRNRMVEAKTAPERAKVVDEAVEQVAKAHPEKAQAIAKEGESLKKALDEVESLTSKKIPPTSKMPLDTIKQQASALSEKISGLFGKYPLLRKYGRDVLVGISTAVYDDLKKEYDLPVGAGSIASLVLGRTSGAGVRVVTNQLAKSMIKKWHIHRAKSQYMSNDPAERKKFQDQAPSVKKKALESIRAR